MFGDLFLDDLLEFQWLAVRCAFGNLAQDLKSPQQRS